MTRRNGHAADRMKPSCRSVVEGCVEVRERFLVLCRLWRHNMGEDLLIPQDLDRDVLLWRTMAVRHKRGDFRNTASELKALKAVAAWTLEVKARMCGKPVPRVPGINE